MRDQEFQKSKAERVLEWSNKPILVLAAVAVILYILELFRVIPQAWMMPFLWLNFIIDLIFLVDLLAKCTILGRDYLRSPWFLIDVMSTLPIISSSLELIGSVGPQLQATRVARAARVARIARITRLVKVARIARLVTAIRARQGLTFLKTNSDLEETPAFNKALMFGIPILLVGFILASSVITSTEVGAHREQLLNRIAAVRDQIDLDAIRKDYDVAKAYNPATEIILIDSPINAGDQVPISLSDAYQRADRLSGILLLVVLLTIAISVMISNGLARDKSRHQERSILSQCFSPAIVNKFYSDPAVIERFYNHWMTVFFIDIRGFTQATEKDINDVEGLALKLRKVMDVARREIVITHEGVVDKFMGDAVMGWVGGHFSSHWDLLSAVRGKLHMDELDLIRQDIKSIKREIQKFETTSSINVRGQDKAELLSVLKEAKKKGDRLLALQKEELEKDNTLQLSLQEMTSEYRRRVAKSAVSCCLKITREVEKIEDPEGFRELKIGIGSGPVLVGNFGSTEQIGFTVLGHTVNRSARLEPASAQCGCHILIDQNTYDLLKDDPDFWFRRVPRITVKGISKEIITYEPFFADQVAESFLQQFERGATALEAGNPKKALSHFNKADELRAGGDAAAKLWSKECAKAISSNESVGVKSVRK
ncbi:MAG: adenylate/guanylate cyclase domain-containing protein [Saprospiraceae bacterium]|nr:adenylate/guanylate cyclase domain-containing protein [Saprospiraceae bacterium]